jgi:hypothetical protein
MTSWVRYEAFDIRAYILVKCKENYSCRHAIRHGGAGGLCRAKPGSSMGSPSCIPNVTKYLFPMYLHLKHKDDSEI